MKDMKIYEVTLKSGAVRFYGYDEDCKIGDTVVAETTYGPLLGQVSSVLDELPDFLEADKVRYILCRVPNKDERATKPHPVPITDCLSEIEQKVKKEHITEIEQTMDKYMEQHKKEIMRLVFADYNEDFNELVKEYNKLKDSLRLLEAKELPDDDATTKKSEIKEDECSGSCSNAPDSSGQHIPLDPCIG